MLMGCGVVVVVIEVVVLGFVCVLDNDGGDGCGWWMRWVVVEWREVVRSRVAICVRGKRRIIVV